MSYILGSIAYARADIVSRAFHDQVIVKNAADPHDPSPVDSQHVLEMMRKNFPEKALGWVKQTHWIGPIDVDPANINFSDVSSWAAHHQPKAVKRFAKLIGSKISHLHPVILVKVHGQDKYNVVDGHHRTLAYVKLGKPVHAYVGFVPSGVRGWQETHSYQFHSGEDPGNR